MCVRVRQLPARAPDRMTDPVGACAWGHTLCLSKHVGPHLMSATARGATPNSCHSAWGHTLCLPQRMGSHLMSATARGATPFGCHSAWGRTWWLPALHGAPGAPFLNSGNSTCNHVLDGRCPHSFEGLPQQKAIIHCCWVAPCVCTERLSADGSANTAKGGLREPRACGRGGREGGGL